MRNPLYLLRSDKATDADRDHEAYSVIDADVPMGNFP